MIVWNVFQGSVRGISKSGVAAIPKEEGGIIAGLGVETAFGAVRGSRNLHQVSERGVTSLAETQHRNLDLSETHVAHIMQQRRNKIFS